MQYRTESCCLKVSSFCRLRKDLPRHSSILGLLRHDITTLASFDGACRHRSLKRAPVRSSSQDGSTSGRRSPGDLSEHSSTSPTAKCALLRTKQSQTTAPCITLVHQPKHTSLYSRILASSSSRGETMGYDTSFVNPCVTGPLPGGIELARKPTSTLSDSQATVQRLKSSTLNMNWLSQPAAIVFSITVCEDT